MNIEKALVPHMSLLSKVIPMTDLQLPGAGLPWYERGTLNFLFKTGAHLLSDRATLKIFRAESNELQRIAHDDESYDVFEKLLIPRVIGIEDSSRNWSVAMVLDHLCLTNAEMMVAVESLSQGIVPKGEVDIALYKPHPDVGIDVFDRFQAVNERYIETIESLLDASANLKRRPVFPHPWFGWLSPHQWHVLAAMHQRIHRRQVQKIVAMLGIT
jgi:hypothetical protein